MRSEPAIGSAYAPNRRNRGLRHRRDRLGGRPASAQVVPPPSSSPSSAPAGRRAATTSSSSCATRSAAPVAIGGWILQGCADAAGNPSNRATVTAGVTLAPGQAYLFTNSDAAATRAPSRATRPTARASPTSAAASSLAGHPHRQRRARSSTASARPRARAARAPASPRPASNADNARERIAGPADTDNNATDFQPLEGRRPAELPRRPAPGRHGAVGRRLRPGNGDDERRPRREPARHVQRARDAADAAFSLTCGGAAIALAVTGEGDHGLRARPGRRRCPRGASCTLRVEGDAYSDDDTDDPPDTGADYSATFTHDRRRGPADPRHPGRASTSRPTATRSSPACPAWSPRAASTASTSRTRSPTATTRTSEGIFVFTGAAARRARGRRRGDGHRPRDRVPPGLHAACAPPTSRTTSAPPTQPDDHRARPRDGHAGRHRHDRADARRPRRPRAAGHGDRRRHAGPGGDDPPLISGDVEASRRRDTSTRTAVRPAGGRHRLLRAPRGHAHRRSTTRSWSSRRTTSAPAPPTRTARSPCWPTAATDASVRADRGPILVRGVRPLRRRRSTAAATSTPSGSSSTTRWRATRPALRLAARGAGRRPLQRAGRRGRRLRVRQLQVPRARRAADRARQAEARDGAKPAGKDELVGRLLQRREPRRARRRRSACRRSRARSSTTCARRTSSSLEEIQDNDGEGPRRPGRRPDVAGARRGDRRGRAARATSTARSTRSTTRTAARRTRTSASASCSTRRGVQFVDRPGGTATTATEDDPAQPGAQLTFSPGRVDPTNPVVEQQPQAAGGRVPLPRQDAVRGREPLRLQGRRRAAVRALPGAVPAERDPAPRQRTGGEPSRSTAGSSACRTPTRARAWSCSATSTTSSSRRRVRCSSTARDRRGLELVDLWHFVPAGRALQLHLPGQRPGPGPHPRHAEPAARRGRSFDAVHINAEFDAEQLSDHDPPLLRLDLDGRTTAGSPRPLVVSQVRRSPPCSSRRGGGRRIGGRSPSIRSGGRISGSPSTSSTGSMPSSSASANASSTSLIGPAGHLRLAQDGEPVVGGLRRAARPRTPSASSSAWADPRLVGREALVCGSSGSPSASHSRAKMRSLPTAIAICRSAVS